MTSQQPSHGNPESVSEPTFNDPSSRSCLLPLAGLLIIVLCAGLTITYRPLFERKPNSLGAASVVETDFTTAPPEVFASAQQSNTIYLAQHFGSETSDVLSLNLASPEPTPNNLTRSESYDEWWAVPSPVDERLAFFAVTPGGERSLRVLELRERHIVVDLTYQSGDSQLGTTYQVYLQMPPQWSEDGEWLAFLGEQRDGKGKAVELFVARSDKVRRLTDHGNVITTFRWLDETTLVYTEARGNGSLVLYQISLTYDPADPIQLAVFRSN
jgi:hypothetical protein